MGIVNHEKGIMSNRLETGMLIKTNYSGPYRIKEVERACTCPSYLDEISMDDPPERPPHVHLVVTKPDGKGVFWLNGFVEETLLSVDKTYCGEKKQLGHDRIIILLQDKPVQLTFC